MSHAILTATPTVDTNIFASGDLIGATFITFSNGLLAGKHCGQIRHAMIVDNSVNTADIDVLFFNTAPSNSTYTENAALTLHATDQSYLIGETTLAKHTSLAASSIHQTALADATYIPFILTSDNLYAVLISRGTPTFTATGVTLRIAISFD